MTPKEFEEACKQPVIASTILSMMTMVPVKCLAMFTLFTKIEKMFNPKHLQAAQRQAAILRRQRKVFP